jgi:hypothetical protein
MVLHTTLIILQDAVAAKHLVADQQVLGCGPAAAKVAALFRKINTLAAATVQQRAVVVVSAIFVKYPFIRRFVLVSVHKNAVLTTTPVEESLYTWADPLVAAVLNCNGVILMAADILLGEVCVSPDNGIRVQEAGAVMTTTKVVILDLIGLTPVVCKVRTSTKSTGHNLDATNGMTFTACVAAAVKATVLQTTHVIVRVVTGIKVRDWL